MIQLKINHLSLLEPIISLNRPIIGDARHIFLQSIHASYFLNHTPIKLPIANTTAPSAYNYI